MTKRNIVIKNALMAFGIESGLVTVLWATFPAELSSAVSKCPWVFLLFISIVAIGFGIFTVRKKKKVELLLSNKVKANIYYGDLFTKDGITVIPVNEYFDNLVDDKVIAINTIHGKFVRNFFGGDEKNLKSQITKSLNGIPFIDTKRTSGNKRQYPLGTVAKVVKENKVFYLVALTKFNENHRASVSNSEYQRVIVDLFTYINQHSQGKKVNIPLIGAGHSGASLSKQKLLEFLLFSIYMNENLTLINGVDIILHTSVENEVNLSMTKILFNSI